MARSNALAELRDLFQTLLERPELSEGSIQLFPSAPEKGDLTPCAVLATADGDFIAEGYGETVEAAIIDLASATDRYFDRAIGKVLTDIDKRYR